MVKTITERILGTTASIRVIDLLMDGRESDYSVSDVGEGAGISRQHAYRVIHKLVGYDIVIKTRIVGGTQLYKIDGKNDISKALLKFNNALLKYQEKYVNAGMGE